MKKKLKELKWKIESLTVFSHIKNDDVIRRLHALLDAVDKYVPDKENDHAISLYSDFVSALYENTADLTDYIHTLLLQDDNFYVKNSAAGMHMDHEIEVAMENELMILPPVRSAGAASPDGDRSADTCRRPGSSRLQRIPAGMDHPCSGFSERIRGKIKKHHQNRLWHLRQI